MKPKLCAAGDTLRDQVNNAFVDRDKKSDGWLGDASHSARKSDHNPDYSSKDGQWAWVRAIDIDKDLNDKPSTAAYLADQIRICAKTDKRIAYCIYNGKIASARSLWRWRTYTGVNRHDHHIHVSFSKKGDLEGSPFAIPLLGDI